MEEHEDNADEFKRRFYDKTIYHRTAWLTGAQRRRLKALASEWKKENPGEDLTEEVARELTSKIPASIEMVAERAVDQLVSEELLQDDAEIRARALNLLRNDNAFKRLVRAAT